MSIGVTTSMVTRWNMAKQSPLNGWMFTVHGIHLCFPWVNHC